MLYSLYLGFPEVGEFLEVITDSGGKLHACKMSVDMFDHMNMMSEDDISEGVEGVIGATDFTKMSEGEQIIFI